MSRKKKIAVVLAGLILLGTLAAGAASGSGPPEKRYRKARRQYHRLLGQLKVPEKEAAFRANISVLREIFESDPRGAVAPRCLFLIAQSHHHLFDVLKKEEDFRAALKTYRKIVAEYPDSVLADDAQFLLGILFEPRDPSQAYLEFVRVGVLFPQGDMVPKAQEKAERLARKLRVKSASENADTVEAPAERAASASGASEKTAEGTEPPAEAHLPEYVPVAYLERVQYWSASEYTRVVVYLSAAVSYEPHTLPPDPKSKRPARIYLDFNNCQLSPNLEPKIEIMDGLLTDVRVGQYTRQTARVVLDLDSMESHRIFSLADPFRVVIDVRGKRKRIPPEAAKTKDLPSMARQLGLTVRRIVIDPGHGGKDKGAIGPHGVYEKDVTLAVAKALKKILEKETQCQVFLTRTTDKFLSLEERTAIANTKKADLFISIHTNAHKDQRLGGVETYILNLSTDKESARVAAFENAVSAKQISDLEAILKDLMQNTKISESRRLAREVHRELVRAIRHYKHVRDLGIKQAPFYVLLGAEMPAILIETAFISNPKEEKLLADHRFQRAVARGIAKGIEAYVEVMNRVATLEGGA